MMGELPVLHRSVGTARALFFAASAVAAASTSLAGQNDIQLPPVPRDGNLLQDYADVLDRDAETQIGIIQQAAFENHQTPIVVVTITSRGAYGGWGHSIEEFARAWFDHWEIGTRGADGKLANHGILVLLSTADRLARIELGADWGRGWDGYAQKIMDDHMVPAFQGAAYDTGLIEGGWALLGMARIGPTGSPPGRFQRLLSGLSNRAFAHTPAPAWVSMLLLALGIGCLVQAYRQPANRRVLVVLGLGFLASAFFLWFLVALLGALFGRGSGSSGGYRASGGFGQGGFSGGGGATGGW